MGRGDVFDEIAEHFATRPEIRDVHAFYRQLFKPVEKAMGKCDPETLAAIIGFQLGGPVSLSTFGGRDKTGFVTYVSCELACYRRQQPSSEGPFEVMIIANDEDWARAVLTATGRLSLEAALDDGHVIDLGAIAGKGARLKGLFLERFSTSRIGGKRYGILRAIGVTSRELAWGRTRGVAALADKLRAAGVYPRSDVKRKPLACRARQGTGASGRPATFSATSWAPAPVTVSTMDTASP
jgi:hypothetical protein